MEKFFKWIKEHKVYTIVIGIVVPLLPVLIIHILYKINIPFDFLVAEWSAGELLQFYGAYLSFLGTVLLGALALWQNHQLSKKNEQFENFKIEQERKSKIPKFDIPYKKWGHNGGVSDWYIDLKNVSANIACNIVVSEFKVYDNGTEVYKKEECCVKDNSLQGGETTTIEFKNNVLSGNNLDINFLVSCLDEFNITHKWKVETKIVNYKCNEKFIFTQIE